jgi:PAS domain S-box-containing protein
MKADQKLKDSLKEVGDFKAALDEHAIVAITDPQGKITYVNDKFCAISKYSREELLGQDHRIINSGHHSKEFIRDLWATIARGKVWHGEIKNKAKDGSFYWVDTTIMPFLNEQGKPRQYVAIRADITERKAVEERLRTSIKEIVDLKSALDEHAIVAITDPQGKITYVNDKFCAISKYSREELLGQDHRIINSGHHSKEFIRDLWATIARGKVWHGEIKNKAKDGSFYWVDTTIMPFLNEQGKPRQYVAIRADITARKAAAAEIVQLNAELEQRVAKRTSELKLANQELEAFSYSISHDLRAPLRAMGGFARILEKEFSGEISPDARKALERIRNNVTKMSQLIDGLLDFSSLNWMPVVKKEIDPAAIARGVFDELRPETGNRHIDIEINKLPPCEADANLLKQVYVNLATNALKYSRHRDPAVIRVGWRKEKGRGAYFVQDNGAGFDMKYADKLFRVFQRLHGADQFEGTGVGLAIVQRIVQRHGGHIWAQAEVDHGATFYFTLNEH